MKIHKLLVIIYSNSGPDMIWIMFFFQYTNKHCFTTTPMLHCSSGHSDHLVIADNERENVSMNGEISSQDSSFQSLYPICSTSLKIMCRSVVEVSSLIYNGNSFSSITTEYCMKLMRIKELNI